MIEQKAYVRELSVNCMYQAREGRWDPWSSLCIRRLEPIPGPGKETNIPIKKSGRTQWWWKRWTKRDSRPQAKEKVMVTLRHCWRKSDEFIWFRHAWMSWAINVEMSCRQKKGQTLEKVTLGLDLGVIHIQVQVKPSEQLCSPRWMSLEAERELVWVQTHPRNLNKYF